MDRDQFLSLVEQAVGTDRESAERATQATLATLGEHLGRDVCRQLVPQLPPELGGWLFSQGAAQSFDVTEFLRRVAERERTDEATAERHVRAVLMVLGRALTADGYGDMVSRLSNDYVPLLPHGTGAGGAPLDAFLTGVARRGRLTPEQARRATDAVLETLGERIGPGEVDDLLTQLPVSLHPPLKRGAARADEATSRMSVDEFLNKVAERAGIPHDPSALLPPGSAREYARAVFNTLRETVRTEFFDVTVQLPNEYWNLAARRT
jgi:uncharacterized protein (DUF2267 family)